MSALINSIKKNVLRLNESLGYDFDLPENQIDGRFAWDQDHLQTEDQSLSEALGEHPWGTYQNPIVGDDFTLHDSQLTHEHEAGFAKHAMSFELPHRNIIGAYKRNSDYINSAMRDAAGDTWHPRFDEARREADLLDHITSHKLAAPLHVFRGFNGAHKWDHLKVGDVVRDHGFASTSLNAKTAQLHGEYGSSNNSKQLAIPRIGKIHLPKGTNAYHFDRHQNNYSDEQEVVLRRGAKFRILGHEIAPFGKKELHVVHMEHIPHEA